MSTEDQSLPVNEPAWGYADDDDKTLGIETQNYPNGQVMKRVTLSDGRIAVARKLKGRDAQSIRRLTGGVEGKYQAAVAAQCVTINGEKMLLEEIEDMWMDDYSAIMTISSINFPTSKDA